MPTKRRKTGVRQRGVLTYAQRSFLVSGRYLFNFDEKFRDDEVCEAWACHRDGILADWCHPGERPPLLWKLDAGLTCEGWPDFWAWPEPFETESDLVRAMVLEGELVGCRFTGNNRIESEVAAIEADWLHAIHVALQQTIGRPQADPFPLTEWRGVPRWFFDRHAPAVKVEIAAERSAWRRSMARYSDTAGARRMSDQSMATSDDGRWTARHPGVRPRDAQQFNLYPGCPPEPQGERVSS